ncbi:MAG: hypothetical protein JXQ71_08500 [Verrucomicrobia bacterium]|nr:hypothetical protein [Verrucomicrobiota bacterium]
MRRLSQSTVVWSWMFHGLRLASGLVLLPLIVRLLSESDLGMYYVFLSLAALVPIVDFGFSVSIGRHVSYAMGGAEELQGLGLKVTEQARGPNYGLLHQLVRSTHVLYAILALITLVLVGAFGTLMVGLRVAETASPTLTWVAWGVSLVATAWEVYAGWWTVFLRGMDQVLLSMRLAVLAYTVKLGLAAILLLAGAGLLSVPAAALVSGVLQRWLSRRACLRRLRGGMPAAGDGNKGLRRLLSILWPTSWRTGLQFSSSYLATSANALICLNVFGLAANAQYGLSVHILQLVQGMALVWTMVKWPLVGQYRTRNDLAGLRRLLAPRVWLQAVTFVVLAVPAIGLGPTLLDWFTTDKQVLPMRWLVLLGIGSFLDMQFSFWTTLLSMENRIPSLWPTVASNLVGLGLVLALIHHTSLGLGAFIVGPLVAGCLFSYWYWPLAGARSLGTTWWRFTFAK